MRRGGVRVRTSHQHHRTHVRPPAPPAPPRARAFAELTSIRLLRPLPSLRPLRRSGSKRSDRAHLWECGESEEDDLATIAASTRSQLHRHMSMEEDFTSSDGTTGSRKQSVSEKKMLAEIQAGL